MNYTRLGNSDLNVSRICMGCMGFGDPSRGQHSWTIDEEHSREIIKKGLELGVNFFDTAIAYQSGTSEQYVGRALRDFANREDVVIATKFLPRTADEIETGISGQQHIENMINTSLRNLSMDHVDLYIYHMWDWNTPLYEIMDGLNRVVKAGKTRYIGISNCFAWQIAKANALAEKEGFAKFVSVQGHYNLIFREEEREMVPYCEEENIALTPYSALASGRLSRKPGEADTKRAIEDSYAKFKYDASAVQDAMIIDRAAEIADKRGVSMTEVSLAWLLTKVTSPVVGATKLHHIEGAVKAVDLELTADEIAYLEEPYVPHPLAGVMAQNKRTCANEKHVWSTGDQSIKGRKEIMSNKILQMAGREQLGEFAPLFAHLNDDVLFGEVWNENAIDIKTKCIITVVSLMASGITDSSLSYHLKNAKAHGVTKEEIAAIITHAAMYVGWPKGWAVFRLAKEIWNEEIAVETEKDNYQNTIFFPIGAPNDAYAKFFVGQSYLAPVSTEQVPIYNVTFEPGCRNNWHIHHAKNRGGQMLICVGGRGYYQEWGKEAVLMTPGTVINIPPEVKHWHGAAPDSWFSHLAIEVPGEETGNEWLEAVDEAAYTEV